MSFHATSLGAEERETRLLSEPSAQPWLSVLPGPEQAERRLIGEGALGGGGQGRWSRARAPSSDRTMTAFRQAWDDMETRQAQNSTVRAKAKWTPADAQPSEKSALPQPRPGRSPGLRSAEQTLR